jgi:SAM-dependent methyltransferase
MTNEWTDPRHVESYLARMNTIAHRAEGEATLLAELPRDARRILDLGCGNGHLLALTLVHLPDATGVGLDFSPTMLDRARERFRGEQQVTLIEHNLDFPLPAMGQFDCVVSSLAIHHCRDERKREIYAEVFSILRPGGVFCNLEHVASPTSAVHQRFLEAMAMAPGDEDPSNRLLDVHTQLEWLREIGYRDVDCFWKWRELALLAGRKDADS